MVVHKQRKLKSADSPQAHMWYCFVVGLMERDERLRRTRRELYRIRSTETLQQREVRLAARRERERRQRATMTSKDRQALAQRRRERSETSHSLSLNQSRNECTLTLPDCSNESTPVKPVLEFCRSNVVIPIIN